MPTDSDILVAPRSTTITISLEPTFNALQSLLLLKRADDFSGLGDWVQTTAAAMGPNEVRRHQLVVFGFYHAIMPKQNWPSFPAYLDRLASAPAEYLRDKVLAAYAAIEPQYPIDPAPPDDPYAALCDADTYLNYLKARFDDKHYDEAVEREAYTYLLDPPAMQRLIVSHLRHMWDSYLEREWRRVEPMLQDAVDAFSEIDYGEMSRLEAAEFITGHELDEHWTGKFEAASGLVFVPSAHIGPYLGQFKSGTRLGLVFGARLPKGASFDVPDLSRADIQVRLSALADDTRLRILKYIAESGERCSRDIIEVMDLSQSAASRHLRQLTASGFLQTRRSDGQKCYRLNPDRVEDTLQAVGAFLLGSTVRRPTP